MSTLATPMARIATIKATRCRLPVAASRVAILLAFAISETIVVVSAGATGGQLSKL